MPTVYTAGAAPWGATTAGPTPPRAPTQPPPALLPPPRAPLTRLRAPAAGRSRAGPAQPQPSACAGGAAMAEKAQKR